MIAETKSHIAAKSTWFRALYMLLFFVIFNVAEVVTWALVILQFLFKLFTGAPNERLRAFGGALSVYFRQVVAFLTFDSEEMPFPFKEWPAEEPSGAVPTPPVITVPPAETREEAEVKPAKTTKSGTGKSGMGKSGTGKTGAVKTGSGKKSGTAKKPAAKKAPKAE